MSKPYPCCCRCVNCPQYSATDDWTLVFNDLSLSTTSIGHADFTSSTTGNPLHVDLNGLLLPPFNWASYTPGTIAAAYYTSGNLFPGKTWNYNDGFIISNIRISISVRDHCGKVWLEGFTITGFAGLGDFTLALFNQISEPASPSSCGEALTNYMTQESNFLYQAGVASVTLTPP